MSNNNKSIICAIIAILSWSTVATMFKISLIYYSHYEMLIIATISALLIFLSALLIEGNFKEIFKLTRKDYFYFSLLGLLNPTLYYLVLFKAYSLLPAQIAQPINYSWPIVLLILISLFTKTKIGVDKFIGLLISLIGVVLISLGTGFVNNLSLSVPGLLLAFLSAFLWASYWLLNKKREYDSNISLFMSFLFGLIYLLVGMLFVNVNLTSLYGNLSSIYVGAFEMGIPFITFAMALKKSSNPTLINQLCYLSPFLSLFLIHIFLKEEIFFTTYIGLILIVFGIFFNEFLFPRLKLIMKF